MSVDSAEQKLNAAVLALVYLGSHCDRSFIAHREIARRQNLPTQDIVGIMRRLADAGFVTTRLGRQGGVSISKPLSQISIKDLYEACNGG